MPRKKQVSINQPIEESMEPVVPTPEVNEPAAEVIRQAKSRSRPQKPKADVVPERIMPPSFELRTEKPKTRFHFSGFLMLLAATAVAGIAVYYWPEHGFRDFMNSDTSVVQVTPKTNNDDNTTVSTGPKTFSNSTYGFEFQYAAQYKVEGDFDKDKSIIVQTSNGKVETVPLKIEFVNKPMVSARGDIATQYEGKIISAKDIKFNGYDAREILYCVQEPCPNRIILISRPGGTLKISHYASTYQDVLSTFKFSESSVNLKTYTDPNLGFSISQPSTWTALSVGSEGICFRDPAKKYPIEGPGVCEFAVSISDSIPQGMGPLDKYFVKSGTYYRVSQDAINASLFTQILATFKFTN